MRRSIKFCEWKALWWDLQHQLRLSVPSHVAEGIAAYAAEQADIERQRMELWTTEWAKMRQQAAYILGKYISGNKNEVLPYRGTLQIILDDDVDFDFD